MAVRPGEDFRITGWMVAKVKDCKLWNAGIGDDELSALSNLTSKEFLEILRAEMDRTSISADQIRALGPKQNLVRSLLRLALESIASLRIDPPWVDSPLFQSTVEWVRLYAEKHPPVSPKPSKRKAQVVTDS